MPTQSPRRRSLIAIALIGLASSAARSQTDNQTDDLSPITVGGAPFDLRIEPVDWAGDPLPAIHSAAAARLGDRILFVGGKTSGIHGFGCDPGENFPPADFHRDLVVIDVATGDVHTRSIDDSSSGLSLGERAAMASINTLRQQVGDHLLVAGGYGLDTAGSFVTFDTLRVIEVPGIIGWTMGDDSSLSDHVRFMSAPANAPSDLATTFFTLTGGELLRVPTDAGPDEYWLCFGHSYQQGYNGCMPGSPNQTYARQVRRFALDLDADPPVATYLGQSARTSWARRRDFNVFPARVSGGAGAIGAAGPFTPGPSPGIWTVPIVVDADGTMSMDDPAAADTLKQGFAAYTSATLPFWSASRGENWLVSLGGIGYAVVSGDRIVSSAHLPYDNSGFALRHAPEDDAWSQHLLLDASFPTLTSKASGETWHHGTETAVLASVPRDAHDMFDLDDLLASGETIELAILHGGIVAEGQGLYSSPPTYASNMMFRVTIGPKRGCDADFDGDGRVNGADLAVMLTAWGEVPVWAIQPADLNGDGTVSAADLGDLLGEWGECH